MTRRDELSTHDDAALLARLALDDRPGPATRISNARAHALVDGAIDAVLSEATVTGPSASAAASAVSAPVVVPFAQRPWVRAVAMAAAALLVLVGGVAAAKLIALMREADPAPAPEAPAVKHDARPAAPAPAPAEVAPAPAEDAPSEPSALDADAREPRAHRASGARAKDVREVALEDLLQQANRARAAGEFSEAAQLYAQVYDGRPSSLSAYVALVAAASLELEHLDHPARARKLFESALRARPTGALDLEARQGLALALRDLGARNDEVAALRTLIARHPGRPAATRARARLAELGE